MIRVVAESMNPREVRGDSGLWKVVIYDYGTGHIIDRSIPGKIHKENLPYEEARNLAWEIEEKLNPKS